MTCGNFECKAANSSTIFWEEIKKFNARTTHRSLGYVETELADFQYCLANTKLHTHNVNNPANLRPRSMVSLFLELEKSRGLGMFYWQISKHLDEPPREGGGLTRGWEAAGLWEWPSLETDPQSPRGGPWLPSKIDP